MKDLKNKIGFVHLLDPADISDTDTKSKLLDLAGFESAVIGFQIGAITGVDGSNYLTPKLQESNTTVDGDFTDVAAADIEGAFSVINSTSLDQVIQVVGYKGTKRYVRLFLDYTGTAITAGIVGVFGVVSDARREPVTAPAAVSAT